MLGLRWCTRAFSSCGKLGPLFITVRGPLTNTGLSCWRSTGSRRAGSVVVVHGPSCSAACGILPDQGSNPCPLHRQADSQPLRHQGSPDIILNGERPNAFLLWSGTKQDCLISSCLFSVVLEVLVSEIRQEEERKHIQTGKEEVNLPLLKDNIVYIENPKWFTKKQGHRIQGQYTKKLYLYRLTKIYLKMRNKQKTICSSIQKIKILGENVTKYLKYFCTLKTKSIVNII